MDEHCEDILKALFDKVHAEDTFARLTGTTLVELKPGFARTTLPVTETTLNIHQVAHGGAVYTVADQACEAAGNSFEQPAVALQNNFSFLAAGKSGDLLEATATVTHRTQRIGLIEFEVRNQAGLLLAKGQQVIYFKKGGAGAR
jgi:acyl-CoA thioesterase